MHAFLRAVVVVMCLTRFGFAADPPALPFAEHPVNQWVKQSPREGKPSPKLGWEGSGAFDPVSRLWIHHAGHDGIPQGFVTFTADPASGVWKQLFPPTSPPGVCCVDGANVFDSGNRVFVRFPGGSLGHGYQWSRGVKLKESPVWLYDPAKNKWTNMRPPPYADVSRTRDAIGGLNPSATYDAVHQLAISFGGIGTSGGKNNLHVYDAYANELRLIKPAGKSDPWPSERDGCGIAYDAAHEKLVVFGGQYTNDEKTWVYDFAANHWDALDLEPHPPARKDKNTYATIPKMTYDSVNNVILCVVWLDEQRGHETWVLDLEKRAWSNAGASMQPENSKSRTRNLDFLPADNVAMLETWSVKGEPQLWTYRYKAGAAPVAWKAPVRKAPRVPDAPVVSVVAKDRINIAWPKHSAADVTGYNLYRGVVAPRAVKKGTPGAWKDNDPEYADAVVTGVKDITDLKRLNDAPISQTTFEDAVDLTANPSADYRLAVYAYIVRAVNGAGIESGPSPYALTIPSEPLNVLCKEDGAQAHLKWSASPERGIKGYHVYKLEGGVFGIKRVTDAPIVETTFTHAAGKDTTRYWIVAVDALGQEGQPSSPAWFGHSYKGFFDGDWHQ